MFFKCETFEQIEQPVLTIRTTTSVSELPSLIGSAYEQVMAHLSSLGQQPAGDPFVIYYNMDMQALDVEMGYPVKSSLPGSGDVQLSHLPAGPMAACLYTGPYADCAPAYEALTTWVVDNGYETTGVSVEYYLNSPAQTPPEQLQTRIVFPLQKPA
ncbi:MAG TPA: GyrI-like domain-containing protein [Anaerolineaceae bacterium]|nr:GyrI-like domain-containing protein [Anaerolineaceae bacterium]HPN51859.1 GyrI-like domain-containing protein [Anaerolineaceae bacterium]